jgi:hypothetical protein
MNFCNEMSNITFLIIEPLHQPSPLLLKDYDEVIQHQKVRLQNWVDLVEDSKVLLHRPNCKESHYLSRGRVVDFEEAVESVVQHEFWVGWRGA